MRNNKGFTLIELVVVIAVMAVITTVSTYVVGMVSKQKLKDFTNDLDAMLCQCKIETMSGMPQPTLELSLVDGVYQATLYKNSFSYSKKAVKTQTLGNTSLKVTYMENGMERELREGRKVSFQYDRVTGELINTAITKVTASDNTGSYAIEFVPKTGFHEVIRADD